MVESSDRFIGRRLGREGQYHLVALLGQGGMAAVYRAEHITAAFKVERAVKVLDPELTLKPGFVERFHREAGIAAELTHPHVVTVWDFGETDKIFFVVMQLVEGGTLADVLKDEGGRPWPLDRVQQLADQILPALDDAHARRIVHRDVKPSNILIARGSAWAYLSDFGIAKLMDVDDGHAPTIGFVGTPAYAAPEQVLGEPLDGRADLYSFGVVLYRLITGRMPYEADSTVALALKHVQGPLPAARTVNPEVPESVELLLNRALARMPADRYQRGEELRQALLDAARGPEVARVAAAGSMAEAGDTQIAGAASPLAGVSADRPTARASAAEAAPAARQFRQVRRLVAIAAGALAVLLLAAGALYLSSTPNEDSGPVGRASPATAIGGQPIATPIIAAPATPPAKAGAPSVPTSQFALPTPTAAVTPTPSGPTPTPIASPGTLLLQDDFSDPSTSRMPQVSANPSKVTLSIEEGEYRVRTLDPATPNELARIPGAFGDATIAIDARLVAESAQRILILGCRGNVEPGETSDITRGYFLFVLPGPADTPGNGSVQLVRRDTTRWVPISDAQAVAMKPGDRINRLELSCVGTSISGSINGTQVVQTLDGTYTEGLMLLGVATNASSGVTSDARFGNLIITQR
jgi:tRNA A-37 threonylcarbamoyl transferase component Bud32